MSNTDSIRSLDPETSAQVMEVVNDLDLHPDDESKARSAAFGSARKRSLKEPSRRDSPTLPWRNPLRLSGAATPQARSPSPPKRSESPDIGTILARTPRPRKTSIAAPPPSKKRLSHTSPKSEHLQSLISECADFLEDDSEGEGGSESDSSIDIHTPLPHLMFRDGLLSPRSKLLPRSTTPFSMYSLQEEDSVDPSGSVLSFASTAGSVTTKSGLQRDPRDTQRRRQRHRDGRLLKAGMGLTTGLGWSDSEDEDAPSALTRRLIHTTLERKRAGSVASGTRPSSMHEQSVSRLASPGPSSPPPLSRKLHSFSNLRSASVSYSSNTPSPLSPASGPGSGPRVPRGRAVSTATPPIARTVSSPLKPAAIASPALSPKIRSDSDANPSLLREKLVTSPVPISQLPTAPRSPPARKRAESSASTASVATTSTSLASISIESLRSTTTPTASTDSLPSSTTHPMRKRTESSASNSTTTTSVSAGSSYSQNSSTSVPSSASSGYRPLHLPRAAGLTGPKPAAIPPRSRTLSHSALPLPSTFVRRTTSGSSFSGVLPAGAPPTLRQRPVPTGARPQPQPRTGTGMVYRTSSYASLHEAGSRMRAASVVASQS